MSNDIFDIAYAMRAASAQSPIPLKLSHAQQCAAAALGYGTLAAYQAAPDESGDLAEATHVVLEVDRLVARSRGLGLPHDEKILVALIRAAFAQRLPGVTVHVNLDQLEDTLRDHVQQLVLNDDRAAGAMAQTNSDGIQEIYLPLDVPWDDIPLDGELLDIRIDGHVSMEPDVERPYAGHRIDVSATLALGRIGRAVLSTVAWRVDSAKLDNHWDGEDEDEGAAPKVSLVGALAEYLGLSFDDASELDDAEVQTLESEDGLIYGYVFDFTSAASETVARKIKRKHGSLSVQMPANFLDRVHGRAAVATRYYVHGDQHEADAGRFFCQQCDLLVDAMHFDAEHPGQAEERYFASLRRWQRRPARTKINLRRPNDAANALADIAEAARRSREASRSRFHRWMEEQLGRDDPVGDLARDIQQDRHFPISEASRDPLRRYVGRVARDVAVAEVFDGAWAEFTQTQVA